MNTELKANIVALPSEAPLAVDDNYLVEMTDRLHRLRALLNKEEKPKARHSKKSKPRTS